jgi:squalene cyclase
VPRAAAYLRAHQLPDGGWGETIESCRQRTWVHAETGQAVMTSWALLALHAAGEGGSPAARRGVAFLKARQQSNGRWPAEHIAGVFNKSCAIHYDAYLRIFPVWALALVESHGKR